MERASEAPQSENVGKSGYPPENKIMSGVKPVKSKSTKVLFLSTKRERGGGRGRSASGGGPGGGFFSGGGGGV